MLVGTWFLYNEGIGVGNVNTEYEGIGRMLECKFSPDNKFKFYRCLYDQQILEKTFTLDFETFALADVEDTLSKGQFHEDQSITWSESNDLVDTLFIKEG